MTNPTPTPHTTHHACKEILAKYGGKSKGCCCTGHECKTSTPKALEELLKNLREYLLDIGKQGRLVNLEYYQIDEMVAKIIKAGQKTMLERVEKLLDEYFKGLIVVADPQLTLGGIKEELTKLKQELNDD